MGGGMIFIHLTLAMNFLHHLRCFNFMMASINALSAIPNTASRFPMSNARLVRDPTLHSPMSTKTRILPAPSSVLTHCPAYNPSNIFHSLSNPPRPSWHRSPRFGRGLAS